MRVFLAAALVVLGAVPPAVAGQPDIEIHAVTDCANSIAPPQTDPNTHQAVCVAPTMIVGGRDVTGVRGVTARTGNEVLEVELSEEASSALFRYTQSRVGQKIAILIDGRLINAPVVMEAPIGRRFQLPGLSKGEIAALVERFRAGPPI